MGILDINATTNIIIATLCAGSCGLIIRLALTFVGQMWANTYHHTMISENVSRWENFDLDNYQKERIQNYLYSRKSGSNDWIWFHDTPEENIEKIKDELGCKLDKPSIGLFTNVIWDAQLHYKSSAFENMLDWVHLSIDYFSKRPDLELFIRIHPAEMRGAIPSRHPVLEEIVKMKLLYFLTI